MVVFAEYAEYYNLLYQDKNYNSEAEYIISLLAQYGITKGKLLDVGCGTGKHLQEFCRNGFHGVGVDISENMLKEAYLNVPDAEFIQASSSGFTSTDTFDAVVSLFHVMSYQASNEELIKTFANISNHLKTQGIFVFDFWYGPAVLRDLPEVRVKRLENDKINVVRIAEPVIHYNDNLVDVNYELHIENKINGTRKTIHECHRMRYLFLPEIKFLLKQNGLKLLHSSEWMSEYPLSENSWNGVIIAQKQVKHEIP